MFFHKLQAPVVRKVDSSIHRISHYPVDSVIGFPNSYPLDTAFEQLGPDVHAYQRVWLFWAIQGWEHEQILVIFCIEKKCFDDFRIIRPCRYLIHTNYQYVLVWKTSLNNALVYQFQSGLKSITTNVARSYAVSTSKIFMMGWKKEESLIFLYFTLRKNELEFSPTQSINQSNNLFTSICGMGLPWSSEPSPLGSHNERKVGNNFLKRGESEWSKNISDT